MKCPQRERLVRSVSIFSGFKSSTFPKILMVRFPGNKGKLVVNETQLAEAVNQAPDAG